MILESRRIADKVSSIDELHDAIRKFEGCALKSNAKSTVIGSGSIISDILLVGEAPGAQEDLYGIPFCGQSGKLLDNILKAIGLSRLNCYITNTVFWRPPRNRKPTPEEISI